MARRADLGGSGKVLGSITSRSSTSLKGMSAGRSPDSIYLGSEKESDLCCCALFRISSFYCAFRLLSLFKFFCVWIPLYVWILLSFIPSLADGFFARNSVSLMVCCLCVRECEWESPIICWFFTSPICNLLGIPFVP